MHRLGCNFEAELQPVLQSLRDAEVAGCLPGAPAFERLVCVDEPPNASSG